MSSPRIFIQTVAANVNNKRAPIIANLLKQHFQKRSIVPQLMREDFASLCDSHLEAPFNEVFTELCKALVAEERKDYVTAFEHHANALNAFLKAFPDWANAILNIIIQNLRKCAEKADEQLTRAGSNPDRREEAARLFQRCIQSAKGTKKYALLSIINNLFQIYFKLNTVHLCANLINYVEGPAFPPFEDFPLSQKVTYKMFVGRVAMFDSNFKKAENHLEYAFNHCHKQYKKNKRLILQYLVCVKLVLGRFPTQRLLHKYNMTEFLQLTEAVKSGNLKVFIQCLDENQDYYIKKGVFLILEKVKTIVYRNLFKKIYKILNTSRIPLTAYEQCIRSMMGLADIDVEEIECIVAGLIYQGYIRGYIAHEKKFLIVSTKANYEPFPLLKTLNKH